MATADHTIKVCNACREGKALIEFYADGRNSDGRQGRCKKCFLAAQRAAGVRLKEKRRFKRRRYRETHLARERRRSLQWAADNYDRVRIGRQNRRARQRAGGGRLSHWIARLLLAEQNCRCPYCLGNLIETGYSFDHYMPLALDGHHEDANMQLTCQPCNRRKSDRDPQEFAAEIFQQQFGQLALAT